MLPPEHNIEVRSRLPTKANGKPPLLFVHGGFCDSWCWDPFFLPWFAARGYAAHALSLRGHGASGGHETVFVAGLDDYVADVEHVMSTLPSAPVLIGHSMGAAVVERIIGTRPVRAAALISPVPPGGLAPTLGRLIVQQPEYLIRMPQFNPLLTLDILAGLRPMYFSDTVAPEILAESDLHLFPESPRALLDMTLRLHDARPAIKMQPFVLGATADRVATPGDVRATAAMYGVQATIVPGLAHMLMLEPEWKTAARPLLDWLERDVVPRGAKRGPASVRSKRA